MKKFACLGLLIASNLLTSCASLDSPLRAKTVAEGPVYRAQVSVNGIAAPPHRMGFVSARNNAHDSIVFICAEPSVDVPSNMVSSQPAGPQAQELTSGTSESDAFTMAKNLSPTAQNLYRGVQLYRDGMQRLCQARMDGVMSDNDFSEKMNNLLNQSVKLITGKVS